MKGSVDFDFTADPPVITARVELAPPRPELATPPPDTIGADEVAADPKRFARLPSGLMWDQVHGRYCRVAVAEPPR